MIFMIRSINTVNKNMNILQKKLENTNANIANVNTPGYKFQDIVQSTNESQEMFNYTGGADGNTRVDLGNFIYSNRIDDAVISFEPGNLYETDKETDYAIAGNGFFTVRMADGQLGYTRNGNFRLNNENQLVTTEGYQVLSDDSKGDAAYPGYSLLITDFDDYDDLVSIGDTLFVSNDQGYTIQNSDVRQGFLETSNVTIVDEIVKLIEISREFESNQKLLHVADETLNKAVNEIGRV